MIQPNDLNEASYAEDSRKLFNLRAFAGMMSRSEEIAAPSHGHDLYKDPSPVVVLQAGAPQTSDDSVIRRLTMGSIFKTRFDSNQSASKTTPRRPSNKQMIIPTNTFVASNGDVYEIQPFMLPPPDEIAALFKELRELREKSHLEKEHKDSKSGNSSGHIANEKHVKEELRIMKPSHGTFSDVDGDLNKPLTKDQAKWSFSDAHGSPKSRPKTLRDGSNLMVDTSPRHGAAVNRKKPRGSNPVKPGSDVFADLLHISGPESDTSADSKSKPKKPKAHRSPRVETSAKPTSFIQRGVEGERFDRRKFSVVRYLQTEMFGIGEPGHLEPDAVGNLRNFLTVPFKLERLICFGWFICLDAFLYVITFLPIRVAYSFVMLLHEICLTVLGHVAQVVSLGAVDGAKVGGKMRGCFHRSHLYDLMRGALLLIGCSTLQLLNMSRAYHYIRGQTLIKLYVLTAMMEIFDKLLCSFGQDAFDSLYCITRIRPEPGKLLFAFLVTAAYVIIHSSLYFFVVATLTVAINSAEQAFLTVLVLNNFAEIKSFVFKKFDKQNLFQLSCSDITERFHLVLFLICIAIVALAQAGSAWRDVLPFHLLVIPIMLSAEAVADWIKHAFIGKFNRIDAAAYEEFLKVLRKDILNCHKDKVILDHTYAITRRVGLAQLPLGCVSIRYIVLALSAPPMLAKLEVMSLRQILTSFSVVFSLLVCCKIIVGVGLVFYAGVWHNQELDARAADEGTGASRRIERQVSMNQLSNIERYTVYKGRIVG